MPTFGSSLYIQGHLGGFMCPLGFWKTISQHWFRLGIKQAINISRRLVFLSPTSGLPWCFKQFISLYRTSWCTGAQEAAKTSWVPTWAEPQAVTRITVHQPCQMPGCQSTGCHRGRVWKRRNSRASSPRIHCFIGIGIPIINWDGHQIVLCL